MSTVPTNPPANPVPGAVYVDLATNTAYVWTGTGWIPSSGSTGYNSQVTTGAAILPGYFPKPSPESYVPQVGSEPLNPSEGQIWVDDTVTPSPAYVWHDTGWVKLTDGTFTDTTVAPIPPASPDLGDTYFETATRRFYVWDGSTWQPVGEGDDTHSIYTMNPPAVRPSGGSLQAGDMWINSVNGNLSYYNGGIWVLMNTGGGGGAQATSIITYATAPIVGAEGDVYYNTTNDTIYVSDGAAWVPVAGSGGADTHSFTGTGTPIGVITQRPDTTALQDGDMYVDDNTNVVYYYDLSAAAWKPTSAVAAEATRTSVGTLFGYTSDGTGGYGGESYNTFLGYSFDDINPAFSGNNNVSIGPGAGFRNATTAQNNVVVGSSAGYSIISGSDNVIIGENSGSSIELSSGAVIVGHDAATNNVDLQDVTAVGNWALNRNTNEDFLGNTAIGAYAGQRGQGAYNIHLGYKAGAGVTTNNSVIIGSYLVNPLSQPVLPDGTFVLARPQATDNTIFRINENNAFGIPTTNGSTAVDYGTSGQVLASQGTGAPPQWTTVSGAGTSATPSTEGILYGYTGTNGIYLGFNNTGIDLNSVNLNNIVIGDLSGDALTTGSNGNVIIGNLAGFNITGENNTVLGYGSGDQITTGRGNIILGHHSGASPTADSYFIVTQHNPAAITTDYIKLISNQYCALGFPASQYSNAPNYGTSGQVLTSQGSTAPPQWTTTVPARGYFVQNNVGLTSTGFNATQEVIALLDANDFAVPVLQPGGTIPDGAYIKVITQQAGTPITFSNFTGSLNWMGGGTTYVWTPAFIGQTATIYYYAAIANGGFGYIVELSSN